jgi:SHS family lactate transporter-like MFS transporter
LPPKGTTKRYKYGLVICIFMGCVYAYVIALTFLGPEYRGRNFDVAADRDMAEAAGTDGAMMQRKLRGGDGERVNSEVREDEDVEKGTRKDREDVGL